MQKESKVIFCDGFTGLTDTELDNLIKQVKALEGKVIDRRKWWNRIFRKKPQRLTGIWYNVKTKNYEIG